jgi:hypothetical protein
MDASVGVGFLKTWIDGVGQTVQAAGVEGPERVQLARGELETAFGHFAQNGVGLVCEAAAEGLVGHELPDDAFHAALTHQAGEEYENRATGGDIPPEAATSSPQSA